MTGLLLWTRPIPRSAESFDDQLCIEIARRFGRKIVNDARPRIEPYPSSVAADSLRLMSAPRQRQYQTARRKIVPEDLERRVLIAFADAPALFRKTSCAVSYAHGLPDYNGHYGIWELCDICSLSQLDRCRVVHRVPTAERMRRCCSTPCGS